MASRDWESDCLKWRGRILGGHTAHWCIDWDYLPINCWTPEFNCCACERFQTLRGRICNWLFMFWWDYKANQCRSRHAD